MQLGNIIGGIGTRKVEKPPIRYAHYLGLSPVPGQEYPEFIDGFTPFEAARAQNLPVVSAFIYAGFPVDAKERSKGEGTLLHNAALAGDTQMIYFLVNIGADVNACNGISNVEPSEWPAMYGQTPLFWAAYSGKVDAVTTLLNCGAKSNIVDGAGHLATYNALKSPIILHQLYSRGIDIKSTVDASKRGALHDAASLGLQRAIQYLVEVQQMDPNQQDCAGNTPAHLAARLADPTALKTLIQKGADLSKTNLLDLTPREVSSPSCHSLLVQYANTSNTTQKDRLLAAEPTNFEYLLGHPKMFIPASVSLIVPNFVLVAAAMFGPLTGCLAVLSLGLMMGLSAKVQSSTRRSIVSAGWFSGALTTGSVIFLTQVFPQYSTVSENSFFLKLFWLVATAAMYYTYMRCVFSDPGIIPSTVAARQEIFFQVGKGLELDHHDYCMTSMIKKPHRAKFCKVTGHCIYRFDHYCVWTGNAVGGGNHRYFMLFLICQTFSQIIVAYVTFYVMFAVRPYQNGVQTPESLVLQIAFLFRPENCVVTCFLIFYNTLIFIFMAAVLVGQIKNTSRNLTSNEAWFSSRYRWMYPLGKKSYSLYDHGSIIENWKEFWLGNLKAEHFVIPDMPEWLRETTRKYYAKQGGTDMSSPQGGGGNDHGHSHNGQACPGHHAPPATGPAAFQEANSASSAQSSSVGISTPDTQRQIALMQGILMQITQGKDTITLPDDVTDSERSQLMSKAEALRERHKAVMAQFSAAAGLFSADQPGVSKKT